MSLFVKTAPSVASAGGALLRNKGQAQEQRVRLFRPQDLPVKRRSKPIILMFIGRRGTGKSLDMVAFARAIKDKSESMGKPRKVLSNIHVDFADESNPFLVDAIMQNPFLAKNALLLIDEVQNAFPGVLATSKVNRRFSVFLSQVRKIGAELIFTTQFPTEVSRIILRQTDFFVRCDYLDFRPPVTATLLWFDWWGQITGKDYPKPWPPEKEFFDWKMHVMGLETVWDQYDSDEYSPALWDENREAILRRMWDFEADESPAMMPMSDVMPTPPASLEEYLDRLGAPFVIMAHLSAAKVMEKDTIKDRNGFVAWLKAKGYKVLGGRTPMAGRPEWFEDNGDDEEGDALFAQEGA